MNLFESDFSLIPIKKIGNPNWEYRKSTWSSVVDPEVHDLFDGRRDQNVKYSRKRRRDGKIEECVIEKDKE